MSRGYLYDCETQEVYLNNNAYSKHQYHCVIIRDKDSLRGKYGIIGLLEVLKGLCEKYHKSLVIEDTWTAKDLSTHIFKLFGEITNEQIKDDRRAKRKARAEAIRKSGADSPDSTKPPRFRKPRTYIVCFEAISQELSPTKRSKLPRQARAILEQVRSQPNAALTELDMQALVQMAKDRGLLNTIQDPWHLFKYYESKFHAKGLILKKIIR